MSYAIETKKRRFERILDSLTDNASAQSLASASSQNSHRTNGPDASKRRRLSPASSSAPATTVSLTAHYLPSSRAAFLERLETFRHVTKWHISSTETVNASVWAKRGWICEDSDTVFCGACKQRLHVDLNVDDQPADPREEQDSTEDSFALSRDIHEGLVQRYQDLVVAAHAQNCPWRKRGCDGSIQRIEGLLNTRNALQGLKARYESLVPSMHQVPAVEQQPNVSEAELKELRFSDGEEEQNLSLDLVRLAICGWERKTDDVIECRFCFRSLGLWLYRGESPMIEKLDPLDSHLEYCPWRSPAAQDTETTAYQNSSEMKHKYAGWELVYHAITKDNAKRRTGMGSTSTPTPTPIPTTDVHGGNLLPPSASESLTNEQREKKRLDLIRRVKELKKPFSPTAEQGQSSRHPVIPSTLRGQIPFPARRTLARANPTPPNSMTVASITAATHTPPKQHASREMALGCVILLRAAAERTRVAAEERARASVQWNRRQVLIKLPARLFPFPTTAWSPRYVRRVPVALTADKVKEAAAKVENAAAEAVSNPAQAKNDFLHRPAVRAALPFINGGLSGMFATAVIQPVDMIKVRLQLAGEGSKGGPKPTVMGVTREVIAGGRVLDLYKGLSAGLLRQAVYTTARLGFFDTFQDILETRAGQNGTKVTFAERAGAGLSAGGLAALVGNPADLALIRMQSDGLKPVDQRANYRSVFDALFRISKNEGVGALWTGCYPTVLRAMALNFGQLSFFSESKAQLKQRFPDLSENTTRFGASAIAGFFASFFSLPFDFLKTRLQRQSKGLDGKYPYKGFFDCFQKVLRQEGPLRFYRGFGTYYVRIAPHARFRSLLFLPAGATDNSDNSLLAHAIDLAATMTPAELLLSLVLTGTQTHYEHPGVIDDKRLEHLLLAGKQILYKSHQESDVRQALGFSPKIWKELTDCVSKGVDVLEAVCFVTTTRQSGTNMNDSSHSMMNKNANGGYASVSDAVARNYLGLVKDIERLNDLCTIARNLLATTRKAQNLAAEMGFDQCVLRVVELCVRVASRGFDGEGGRNDPASTAAATTVAAAAAGHTVSGAQNAQATVMSRNEERWQKVVNLYKRLLITCLQFLHNFIMHNEQRKLVLDEPREAMEDVAEKLRMTEKNIRSTTAEFLSASEKAAAEGHLTYSIEDVQKLFELMSQQKGGEATQEQARVLMEKIKADMDRLNGLSPTDQEALARMGAMLKGGTTAEQREDNSTAAALLEQVVSSDKRAIEQQARQSVHLPDLTTYADLVSASQEITDKDLEMPRTSQSAAETLKEAKDELMARLQEPVAHLDENGEIEYEVDPNQDILDEDDMLDSAQESLEASEEGDDDESYQRHHDQERGLLTDVPLVLGPTEIEALPMIIQAGIVDNFGTTKQTAAERQNQKNMQAVRCHILLAQEAGRNVLRELLIFIAAWDLPDDEFYFKMMVQIMEAILKNGLMSHAYSDFGQAKDIISPAQAVVIKILTHIFRTKYSPTSTNNGGEAPKPRMPATLSRVDVLTVRYIFTVFRGNIVPETCALIYLQGQIRAGLALAEDFPLNLWDMERVYEGVYQFLEFFAVLTENNDWKRLLIEWEIVYDLVTLIKELDASIPKVSLIDAAAAGAHHPPPPPPPPATVNLIVLVLSSLVWKSPLVQRQIREHGGIDTILSCTQYDGNNLYIKEHAVMCIKFLLEGNEENQRLVEALEAGGVSGEDEGRWRERGFEIAVGEGGRGEEGQ
ncbi:hypothetical protein DV737_g2370, partial [Chaetothyriales sp. CBS 132003]